MGAALRRASALNAAMVASAGSSGLMPAPVRRFLVWQDEQVVYVSPAGRWNLRPQEHWAHSVRFTLHQPRRS